MLEILRRRGVATPGYTYAPGVETLRCRYPPPQVCDGRKVALWMADGGECCEFFRTGSSAQSLNTVPDHARNGIVVFAHMVVTAVAARWLLHAAR